MVCEHEYMNMSTPLIDSGDATEYSHYIHIINTLKKPLICSEKKSKWNLEIFVYKRGRNIN
jgi:hypothetical protein